MLNAFKVILVIFAGILATTISGILMALRCPNCKRWFALVWQDLAQRDICKYCAWTVDAKDFVPPKASWLKWLEAYSPLKKFTIRRKK